MDEAQALAQAGRITQTMQTEGWSLIRAIMEEQINLMETIKGITSLKELQAKQHASKCLRDFLNNLDTISSAKETYVKTTTLQKVKDPIFKVLE